MTAPSTDEFIAWLERSSGRQLDDWRKRLVRRVYPHIAGEPAPVERRYLDRRGSYLAIYPDGSSVICRPPSLWRQPWRLFTHE